MTLRFGRVGARLIVIGCCLQSVGGCRRKASTPVAANAPYRLAEQRAHFQTRVFGQASRAPAPEPPADVFEHVRYPSPLGSNVAYVSPVKEGPRRPAIVWIAGGIDWGIDDGAWLPGPRSNDQSARAFREAGIVLMRPALRGSNDDPGNNECFLGEVDDIIAAAAYLAQRADVIPDRIYLGGHSTGGTMVLLVAESTKRFRAIFAFGPVANARQYGEGGCLPSDAPDEEATLRSPIEFLNDIRTPTLVIEGEKKGNAASLRKLKNAYEGDAIQFDLVPGASHFSVLAPATEALAAQILADSGPTPHFNLDVAQIAQRVTPQ